MKAVRIHKRGGPEELVYEDAPCPILGPGEVLVRVCAVAVTPTELNWDATYTTRDGVDRLPSIPSHDVSGTVEKVSPGVTDVKVEDAVYALTDFWRDGTAAEYVAVRADDLAPKPASLDHTSAAAVPLSSLTAWQALFDQAHLAPGQRVLIQGAAGGVGSFAVQLAHWRGAHVIGTCSTHNIDFVRRLGADEVIDYTAGWFADQAKDIDLVVDTVGGVTRDHSWGMLKHGGTLVTTVEPVEPDKPARYGVRGVFFIVVPRRSELIEIAEIIDAGFLRPTVAEVLPLEIAREAFQQCSPGHNRGKTVLRVR